MKKYILIEQDDILVDPEIGVNILIRNKNIVKWCIYLSMLSLNAIPMLKLKSKKFDIEIRMNENKRDDRVKANYKINNNSEKKILELSCLRDELDYWNYFYLLRLRDGMSDVNHFDIEATYQNDSNCLYLTFMLEENMQQII